MAITGKLDKPHLNTDAHWHGDPYFNYTLVIHGKVLLSKPNTAYPSSVFVTCTCPAGGGHTSYDGSHTVDVNLTNGTWSANFDSYFGPPTNTGFAAVSKDAADAGNGIYWDFDGFQPVDDKIAWAHEEEQPEEGTTADAAAEEREEAEGEVVVEFYICLFAYLGMLMVLVVVHSVVRAVAEAIREHSKGPLDDQREFKEWESD